MATTINAGTSKLIVWNGSATQLDSFFQGGSKKALTIDPNGSTLSFEKGRPSFTQTLIGFSAKTGYLIETDESITIPSVMPIVLSFLLLKQSGKLQLGQGGFLKFAGT